VIDHLRESLKGAPATATKRFERSGEEEVVFQIGVIKAVESKMI
jgi:hypothetical protein